ncbi:hypothetical protein ZWY2020_053324 [Hordeum vulgare]|nr:hypothetical protein ZWY2020_053324 [Hordeum vulgare]
MAAVDMRMSIRSTLLERFRRLDPGLVQVKVVLAVALLGFTAVLAVAIPAVLLMRYDGHPIWPLYTDLARLSYGLLAASSTASEIGPGAAVLALHLTTVYAAAYLGYALALHRLAAGTERAIRGGALPLPNPACRTRAEARNAARTVTLTVTLTAFAVTAVWTALMYLVISFGGMPDELVTVSVLSSIGSLHAAFWVPTVGVVLLNGAMFPGWMEHAMFVLIGWCGCMVSTAIHFVAGALSAAVLQWLLLMALVAFLGYCLAVYITYLHVATAAADAAPDDGIVDHDGHDAGEEVGIQQEELPLEHGKEI